MRRLRAGTNVPPLPGGPGAPLGRYYGRSARSFAGLGAVQWFAIRELSVPAVEAALETRTGNRTANQETRARGQKSRDGAPGGARILERECGKTEDWCAARCSIPSALRGAKERKTAPPRRKEQGRWRLPASFCQREKAPAV